MTQSGMPPDDPGQPPQPPQPPLAPPPGTPPPYATAPDPFNLGPTQTGMQAHVAGLLCYVLGWVSALIFLLIEPRNKFVRFHALQSLILSGAISVLQIAVRVVMPWGFGTAISGLLGLAGLVVWIVGMVNAIQGRWFKFPVVGDYAAQTVQQIP
jgi:uncharacterized membrane protein